MSCGDAHTPLLCYLPSWPTTQLARVLRECSAPVTPPTGAATGAALYKLSTTVTAWVCQGMCVTPYSPPSSARPPFPAAVEVLHLVAASLYGGLAQHAQHMALDRQAALVGCVEKGLVCGLPAIQIPAAVSAGRLIAHTGQELHGGEAGRLADIVQRLTRAQERECIVT